MTIINNQRIIADDRTDHEQSAEKADAHSFLRASDKADREGQDQQKIGVASMIGQTAKTLFCRRKASRTIPA